MARSRVSSFWRSAVRSPTNQDAAPFRTLCKGRRLHSQLASDVAVGWRVDHADGEILEAGFKNKGPNSVLCRRNPVLPYELCELQDPDEAALGLRTPHYEPKHMQSTFISLFVM